MAILELSTGFILQILVQKLNAVMERFASLKDPGLDAAARLAAFHAAAFNEYVVLMVLHIKATVIWWELLVLLAIRRWQRSRMVGVVPHPLLSLQLQILQHPLLQVIF